MTFENVELRYFVVLLQVELVTLTISPNSKIIADDVFQLDTLKMRGAKNPNEKKQEHVVLVHVSHQSCFMSHCFREGFLKE